MKKHRSIFKSVFFVFSLVLLSGCASDRDLIRDNTITLERIDSNIAYFKSVSIQQFDKEVFLRGTVKRRHSGRGTVRDHVDAMLTQPDGRLIYINEVPYYHKNIKKGKAQFQVTFSEELKAGSLLRLSLHNTSEHVAH